MNPPSPVSRNSPASTRSNKLSSQPLSTSCCTAARSPASGVSPGRAAPASPLAAPVIASALVLVVIGITPSDPGSRQDPRLVHRTHTQAIRHALLGVPPAGSWLPGRPGQLHRVGLAGRLEPG